MSFRYSAYCKDRSMDKCCIDMHEGLSMGYIRPSSRAVDLCEPVSHLDERVFYPNPTEIAFVVSFMVIMITVGVLMARWNKDADDYFKGGNKLPYWLAGLSLFMSSFSSWTFTGRAGQTYESGISIFSMYWGAVLGLGFGYFVFAKRWRRTRSMTILEYLSERFDFNVHQFISWANTPVTIFQWKTHPRSVRIFSLY